METWKKINGYEQYSVSDKGRVRNDRNGYILKPVVRSSTCDYLNVLLPQGSGKYIHKNVHALVAEAFIGERKDGLVVNHKDGNKHNNCADNLEWVTRSQNDIHAFDMGLRRSESSRILKAIDATKRKVRNTTLGTEHESIVDAARYIGGQHSGVSKVLSGERKTYYGMRFEYAS